MMILTFLIVIGFGFRSVSAQFPIKIPKLSKSEKTKPEQPQASGNSSSSNQTTSSDSTQAQSTQNSGVQDNSAPAQTKKFARPVPPDTPLLLLNTLEISVAKENEYWKFPKQRYYSNWIPKVSFKIHYDNNERIRYTAEWFKPDNSLWYSESLEVSGENYEGAFLKSPYNAKLFENTSTDQIGAYGLKITNKKTNEVVFQGKFNVKKSIDTPGDADMKNFFQFFVDNDWHLATGYAGINQNTNAMELQPEVLLWFKGEPERKDLEARLFFNNQEIASTDDGGSIVDDLKRGDDCVRGQEICRYVLYSFQWNKFKFNSADYLRGKYPNAIFTEDKPGEYTAKIFYKGAQVREAKFTVAPDGTIARNGFSNYVYPLLTLIPVKVMGTTEKWNPNSWKTGMFYGNPIAGFAVQ